MVLQHDMYPTINKRQSTTKDLSSFQSQENAVLTMKQIQLNWTINIASIPTVHTVEASTVGNGKNYAFMCENQICGFACTIF